MRAGVLVRPADIARRDEGEVHSAGERNHTLGRARGRTRTEGRRPNRLCEALSVSHDALSVTSVLRAVRDALFCTILEVQTCSVTPTVVRAELGKNAATPLQKKPAGTSRLCRHRQEEAPAWLRIRTAFLSTRREPGFQFIGSGTVF